METGRIAGDGVPTDILLAAEQIYEAAVLDLIAAIHALQGGGTEVKAATQAAKDLRTAFHTLMEERTRVDKLRKQTAGAAASGALDFDAARIEIGRRLARLRAAGSGG